MVAWLRKVSVQRPRESYLNEMAMFLAGRAAEEVVLGTITDGAGGGRGSDLHRAADLATVVEATLGMGSALSYSSASTTQELENLRRSDPVLRRRVERLLRAELERATEIIRRRREDVEPVAKLLAKKELISGDEMRHVFARRVTRP
ncbi:MAG: hypothetical protein AAAB20_00635 [Rhizobium sp.]|uniref:hypothetical protein n=1 Tax=Rhizobium sp. TaxID=391 RepID=UPI0030F2DC87